MMVSQSQTIERLCQHFGDCGGCASQDVAYETQLAAKEAEVQRVVEPFKPQEFRPILASPGIFYYRNKMEFAFAGNGGELQLGLRRQGRFNQVVNLKECLLLSPETGALLEAVRQWAIRENLTPYDLRFHQGFLRYLVVREGKNTGERLVCLVTAAGDLPEKSFLESLAAVCRIDTVVWSVHDGLSDVARGARNTVLAGPGYIKDNLNDLTFHISPTAFFQTNTRGAETLYGVVRDYISQGADPFIDFYCGGGAIGLFCADRARRVLGVEIHPPAVEDARANAARLGINAQFICADAAEFARSPELLREWTSPNAAVVMDPPRAGLAPAVKKLLCEHLVARWVYVSCNPRALAADLPILNDAYQIKSVQPVDMFPHTPHVETVLLLESRPRPR